MRELVFLIIVAIIGAVSSKAVDEFWNNHKEKSKKKNKPPFIGYFGGIDKRE